MIVALLEPQGAHRPSLQIPPAAPSASSSFVPVPLVDASRAQRSSRLSRSESVVTSPAVKHKLGSKTNMHPKHNALLSRFIQALKWLGPAACRVHIFLGRRSSISHNTRFDTCWAPPNYAPAENRSEGLPIDRPATHPPTSFSSASSKDLHGVLHLMMSIQSRGG